MATGRRASPGLLTGPYRTWSSRNNGPPTERNGGPLCSPNRQCGAGCRAPRTTPPGGTQRALSGWVLCPRRWAGRRCPRTYFGSRGAGAGRGGHPLGVRQRAG
eukprot:gene19745-biopygen23511